MTTHKEAWIDLHERLIAASHELRQMGATRAFPESVRIGGKANRIDLALSYMDEWERAQMRERLPASRSVTATKGDSSLGESG